MTDEEKYEEEKKSGDPLFGNTPSIANQMSKTSEEEYGTKGGEVERDMEEEVEQKHRRTPLTNDPSLGDHATNDKSLTDHILGN